MDEIDARSNGSEIATASTDAREVRVFLCYRRGDGFWHAEWLYRHLNGVVFRDTNDKPSRVRLYYDKVGPGVDDWTRYHFPSLQESQAMIFVCTPGTAIDFSRPREKGQVPQPDWLYEELRWWSGVRSHAPIVIDATGEGTRWLPTLINRKWPNINRIDLVRETAEAAEDTDASFSSRICARIIDTVRLSERSALFEDVERLRNLSRRLKAALASSLLLLLFAAGGLEHPDRIHVR
jgi:hypothetical protein